MGANWGRVPGSGRGRARVAVILVAGAFSTGLGGCATLAPPSDKASNAQPGQEKESRSLAGRLLAALPGLVPGQDSVRSKPKIRPEDKPAAGSVRGRLVQVANREWKFFGGAQWRLDKPSIRGAGLEHQSGYRERVIRYWADGLGRTVTNTRRVGWSGAFISYVMKAAGAESRFPYSGTHTTYIARAIRNRKAGRTDAGIVGYRPGEYAPQPGDMVCNSLTAGIDYDNIDRRYNGHCDIVVDRGFRRVEVIGGNLTNSVRKRSLLTDEKGYVYPEQPRKIDPYVKRWFVIVKVNM